MNCEKCGNVIKPGNGFCENCGCRVESRPVQPNGINVNMQGQQPMQNNYNNGKSYFSITKMLNRFGIVIIVGIILVIIGAPFVYTAINANKQKVEYGGYTYKISKKYKVEETDSGLSLNTDEVVAMTKISFDENLNSTIAAADEEILRNLFTISCIDVDCTVKNVDTKVIDDHDVYVSEMIYNGIETYMAIYKTPDNKYATTIYFQKDKKLDFDQFEDIMEELLTFEVTE